MKRKLLRCVTALAALLSASCSSDPYLSLIPDNGGVTGEEVEVTFSISAEASPAMTRADGDSNGTENDESKVNTPGGPGQWQTNIGRGKNIDMLIYAVYEKHTDSKGKDEYILLSQYGKEAPATLHSPALPAEEVKNRLDQAILDVSGTLGEGKSQTITLRLMRNKEYYIAFWAQSSQTTAFKTDNLENVQVRYNNAKNNDELRDAFCKVESFSVSPATENSTHAVILTRPMAQINVGTTGADYKHLMKGKNVYPNKRITHSKISLSGVAQYLNVLTDQVLTEENGESTLLTKVEFAYDFIPALQFMKDDYRNSLLAAEKEDYLYPYWYNGKEYYKNGTIYEETQEEFLKVNLNDDDKIYRYKANYPTIAPDPDKEGNTLFLTETFKYLSMCYVLVPAEHIPASTEPKYTYANSLLDKVTVTFAENTLNDGTYQDYQTINLTSVPVHRNWRTNILGGLKYMKDPTDPDDPGYPTPDPEDPDDPDNPDPDPDDPTPDPEDPDEPTPTPPGDEGPDDTSVFKFTNILLSVDPIYKGEYTSDEDPKWEEWLQDPNNSTTGGDTQGED